jgi:phosphate butyryltransferase
MAKPGAMTGKGLAELTVGDAARAQRTLTSNDLVYYSHASGDLNPLHLPELDGDGDGAPEALAPPAWLSGLISALIGSQLPGPGSRELSWRSEVGAPVRLGETVTVSLTLIAKSKPASRLRARSTARRA